MFRMRKTSIIYGTFIIIAFLIVLSSYSTAYSTNPLLFYSHPSTSNTVFEYLDLISTLSTDLVLTDIKIKRCARYSTCDLQKLEVDQGWKKIDTPLELYAEAFRFKNIKGLMYNHYVYYKNLQRFEVESGLVDVIISTDTVTPQLIEKDSDKDSWISERSDSSLVVWKKFKSTEVDVDEQFIRSVEVLFGYDDLSDSREHWNLQEEPIPIQYLDNVIPPHLSFLKVSFKSQQSIIEEYTTFEGLKKNQVLFSKGNYFKVLQISDLHFGPDRGTCYGDEEEIGACAADIKTLELIENSIKFENDDIDLIIITGDLIDSFKTKDFKSTILKGLSIILQKKIPFIFTFGELDESVLSESEESKSERTGKYSETDRTINPNLKLNILRYVSSLPRCYNTYKDYDKNLHGLTNYNLKIFKFGNTKFDEPDGVISILDSENHKIHATQINQLSRFNKGIKSKEPFKLLFFHYPLPNYRPEGEFQIIGSYNQKNPLNVKTDTKFRDDIYHLGYQVVSVGHEHENDACILSDRKENGVSTDQLWLCYTSVTGQSGDTVTIDYERRLRFFRLDFEKKQLLSWKRKQPNGEHFDYQEIFNYNSDKRK